MATSFRRAGARIAFANEIVCTEPPFQASPTSHSIKVHLSVHKLR